MVKAEFCEVNEVTYLKHENGTVEEIKTAPFYNSSLIEQINKYIKLSVGINKIRISCGLNKIIIERVPCKIKEDLL